MSGEGFFDVAARLTAKKASARIVKPAAAPDGAKPLTVSQLTNIIDSALKAGVPATVVVRGEISNANLHRASGHLYFTMKDSVACIDCVMFRDSASRLKFTVSDGIEMIATGRVAVYAGRGKYQLYATSLQPMGQGALELAFRQLQMKLAAEGLFAPERKKAIPLYPMNIALITSQSTAALADMLKVLRRFCWLRLMVYHVPVQGEGSGGRIAAAIRHLNVSGDKIGGVDVILLGRGGGSLEDLWAFNEESVARAMAASLIPIVTGIGHEVDCSIADLVADHHAHTPTEAAQVVTENWKNVADAIDLLGVRLRRSVQQTLADARQRLLAIERHESFRRPMDRVNSLRQILDDRQRSITLAMIQRLQLSHRTILEIDGRLQSRGPATLIRRLRERLSAASATMQENHPRHLIGLNRQKLSSIESRLNSGVRRNLKIAATDIDTRERQLHAIGPQQVLKRGYTITRIKKTGVIVRSIAQIKEGDRLVTRTGDGEAESIAQDQQQLPLFD